MYTRLLHTLLFLFSVTFLSAQAKRIYTTQRAEEPPKINGVFDDMIWQNAEWSGDFTQYDPRYGAAPSQKTSFAIRYDDNNIYVAIKAFDTEPDKIENQLTRRDGWGGDIVGIQFDSYYDKQTAFFFIVTDAQIYEAEAGNPFADGKDFGINIGVDGKIGLTNDFILDFAINPDFGQVEADPSEVNLSTFESFFAEKRPFFIEGKNITNFQLTPGGSPWASDNLFYSRRIDRTPHGYPDLADNEFFNEH